MSIIKTLLMEQFPEQNTETENTGTSNKMGSMRLMTFHNSSLLWHFELWVSVHEVSLCGESYHAAHHGVQEVLNVREVECHHWLDGDRLVRSEGRVEGSCCEPFLHCLTTRGLCHVCLSSLRTLAFFKPKTVEDLIFEFLRRVWHIRMRIIRACRPMALLRSSGSCRRSTSRELDRRSCRFFWRYVSVEQSRQ